MFRRFGLALFFSLTLVGNLRTAKADVAPPDVCYDEGASCNNVATGGKGGVTGTCQKAKCRRAAPPGEAGAGGDGIIVYDCLRCLRSAGGAGGSPATGGASGSPATGGSGGSIEPPPGGSAGEPSGGSGGLSSGGTAGSPASGGAAGETSGGTGGDGVLQGGSAGSGLVGGEGGVTGVTSGGCDCSIGRFRHDRALALLMVASGLYLLRRSRRQR